MATCFGLARDEHWIMHAYRRSLTLCGEWVDAGRWSCTGTLFTSPTGVTCELCRDVVARERNASPTT